MVIVSTFAFNYGVGRCRNCADERWGGESWFGLVLSVFSGIGSFAGSLLDRARHAITMRWYLGVHGAARGRRHRDGVGAEPGGSALLWGDRCSGIGGGGVHQRPATAISPAGEPARHRAAGWR